MKRSAALVALTVLVSILPAYPASPHTSGPVAAPSLYLMADITVEVAKAPGYEAAFKALISALKDQAFPVVFDTYTTDDSHYYVIYGLEGGYAAIDGLHKAWAAVAAKIGPAKFQALHTGMTAAETSRVLKVWTFRTDLSFLPSPERLKPGEAGYYTWDYVWLLPGKEAEFEAVNRDWITLSATRKARDPFMTYQGGIGNEEPVYCWFEYGKNAADYALAEERFWKSLHDAGAALSKRTRALIRRLETKTGRYRPDLSYAPAK